MTVEDLGRYWMRRRRQEVARSNRPVDPRRGHAGVSPQTLACYQSALSRIIDPSLGGLKLTEATPGVIDEVLGRVDASGCSTRVARSVLTQMFSMAVRHDALQLNPMRELRRPPRRRHQVHALTALEACELLRMTRQHQNDVARDGRGRPMGGRRRTGDLHDVVLLLLASGMRIGEALALRWSDIDLVADPPTVRVAATLVEPRADRASGQVFVTHLHRQPTTKTGATRVLALPTVAVEMLQHRRHASGRGHEGPIFASANGGWLWPNNLRAKLRGVVRGTVFEGVSPHTLRRTVGTVVANELGLDAARQLLGHRDPSVTARHYVAETEAVIDARLTLANVVGPAHNPR